jgi:ATP-dependent helicase/nuclease subunit B
LKEWPEESQEWKDLIEVPGAWAALWATFKDMKDAKVNAANIREMITQEGGTYARDVQRVVNLYELVVEEGTSRQHLDRDDMALLAESRVRTSSFLRRQEAIVYYGFYDLTQVQLDVFQHIARLYPTHLYFPLVLKHEAFLFAENFFQRYASGLQSQSTRVLPQNRTFSGLRRVFSDSHTKDSSFLKPMPQQPVDPAGDVRSGEDEHRGFATQPFHPSCRIVQVSGREDEVAVVAKDIIGMVKNQGVKFHEIGVVGRSLMDYELVIPRVFAQHAIPFSSPFIRRMSSFPLGKTAMQLLSLPIGDYPREHLMEVFFSPYFHMRALCPQLGKVCRESWDLLSRQLGIVKGLQEWNRLERFLEEKRTDPGSDRLESQREILQAQSLWIAVNAIHEVMSGIPDSGTWEEYVQTVTALFRRFLCSPNLGYWSEQLDGQQLPHQEDGQDRVSVDVLEEQLEELQALHHPERVVGYEEFVAAFRRLMEAMTLPVNHQATALKNTSRVKVLDAMAARGIRFRVLYVIGLIDKVFPRAIQEDSFLRDQWRRLIEINLGCKIPEKLMAYDEEKLLFYLLINSASDSLTLLYQRSDQQGRSQLPSPYLDEVRKSLGDPPDKAIPRRYLEKMHAYPMFGVDRLTPQDRLIKNFLSHDMSVSGIGESYPQHHLISQGLQFIKSIDRLYGPLAHYDGMTGNLEAFWATRKQKGWSASSLERYGICPFQFFGGKVLKLRPLEHPEVRNQVGSLDIGNLVHAILKTAIPVLLENASVDRQTQKAVNEELELQHVAQAVFQQFAHTRPVGYFLLWQLQQERILFLVNQVVQQVWRERDQGWSPILFEEPMQASLMVSLPEGAEEIVFTGQIDRVDWSSQAHTFRIIDYKYTESTTSRVSDKNLVLGAVRGVHFQPPVYVLLVRKHLEEKGLAYSPQVENDAFPTCEEVRFDFIAPNWGSDSDAVYSMRFPGDAWESPLREQLEFPLITVLQGIQKGQFFISPGRQCDWCDFRTMCRKAHSPTAQRARLDHQVVNPLRTIRQAQLPKTKNSSL